jgi:hypothetical protein
MEEYVLDNGNIKLGPDCIGAAEFMDGHYEQVVNAYFITKAHFRFFTSSGLYSYKLILDEQEILYYDSNPYTFFSTKHEFAKYDQEIDEWRHIDDIKQVYLYTPAFEDKE